MLKYFILFTFFFSVKFYSQNEINGFSPKGLQYGFAGKVNLEFNLKNNPSYKISLVSGIGYNIKNTFFPTLHTGIILFNRGVVGSNLQLNPFDIQKHFFGGLMGTIKLDKKKIDINNRHVPLYHFLDFSANPIQNPYRSSISYGAIWVNLRKKINQRIGFFNVNVMERGQISYFNDGGPVLKIAGDKHDRYYTGGLMLSYHANYNQDINLIELSYIKFTGYTKHAFDIGDKLQIDFLTYADKEQFSYNTQRWKLSVSNINDGFGANFSIYDFNRLDLQDFLHFNTNVPYHPDYNKSKRLMIGGNYQYNYIKLSK